MTPGEMGIVLPPKNLIGRIIWVLRMGTDRKILVNFIEAVQIGIVIPTGSTEIIIVKEMRT